MSRDVIIGCAVDMRRNIAGVSFPAKMNEFDRVMTETGDGFEELSEEYMFRVGAPGYPDTDMLLCDRTMWHGRQITPDMCFRGLNGTMLMTNAGDHIVMRVRRFDADIDAAYRDCAALESKLSKAYDFAFDENLGYLTASLNDTGNAMHAQAILHLPALTELEKIEDTRKQLEKEGFDLIKLVERDESACAFYCLQSRCTLGKTSEEVISETREEMKALETAECVLRDSLVYDDPEDFADKVLRSLGVLENARLLDFEELLELYSDVRMGIIGGLLSGSSDELDMFVLDLSPQGIFLRHGEVNDKDDLIYRANETRLKLSQAVSRRDME